MTVRRAREERGAAAVEFAFVALIMVTLVAAVFQFAIYLWAFQAASHGAREGARAWAVNPCATTNPALVVTRVGPAARPGSTVATATFAKDSGNTGTGREPGDRVTVTVKMKAPDIGLNVVPGWDYNADIVKTATARVEDTAGCP